MHLWKRISGGGPLSSPCYFLPVRLREICGPNSGSTNCSLFTSPSSPSPAEITNFNDASPPLYPIIAHWLLPIVQNDALAVRLPATLGYCAMILCLMAFARRRLSAVFAFAASLLAFEPTLYYATEGRAYGLVLGCAAAALICWQMAAEGRRRTWALVLLAICLALMVALHYYAIFFLVPLCLAEIVRWRSSGRMDFAMMAAMAPAPLVLGLHYVLLVAGQNYDANFWAHASLGQIAPFYERFLLPALIIVRARLLCCRASCPDRQFGSARACKRRRCPCTNGQRLPPSS